MLCPFVGQGVWSNLLSVSFCWALSVSALFSIAAICSTPRLRALSKRSCASKSVALFCTKSCERAYSSIASAIFRSGDSLEILCKSKKDLGFVKEFADGANAAIVAISFSWSSNTFKVFCTRAPTNKTSD